MDTSEILDLARQAVVLMLVLSAPVLVVGMVVGIIISVMQAVTQVQEQTLSFVPKIVIMLAVAILTAPWAVEKLLEFSRQMFGTLP